MKLFLLFLFSTALYLSAGAQDRQVSSLPAGRYEAFVKQSQSKWSKGDILLMEDGRYRVSSSQEVGEYKFSATAQRVFFTSGPLKTVFAKTILMGGKPVIILPQSENGQKGVNLASSDIMATLRKAGD